MFEKEQQLNFWSPFGLFWYISETRWTTCFGIRKWISAQPLHMLRFLKANENEKNSHLLCAEVPFPLQTICLSPSPSYTTWIKHGLHLLPALVDFVNHAVLKIILDISGFAVTVPSTNSEERNDCSNQKYIQCLHFTCSSVGLEAYEGAVWV